MSGPKSQIIDEILVMDSPAGIAKAATGHAHISTTQIYAERDLDAAKKVALKFG